jgi:hypothetical protein
MELYLEKLNISDSAKKVIKDYFSDGLDKSAYRYEEIVKDLSEELSCLNIKEWVEERLRNKKLEAFIIPDKWYFVHVGLLDEGFISIFDAPYLIHSPFVDIILLGPHAYSLPQRKRSFLHEIIHDYIFHNHEYLKSKIHDVQDPIEAFNKKIEAQEEINGLSEYIAELVPYLFPTIAPAYGNVKLTSEAEKLIESLTGEKPSKLLNLATQFKTLEEVERYLYEKKC